MSISREVNQANYDESWGFPLLDPILNLPNYRSFRKPRDTRDRENNITSLLSFQVGKQRLDTANCVSLSQIPFPY